MKFDRMSQLSKGTIALLIGASLAGCFDSIMEDKAEKFVGTYDNQYNDDKLVFANKMVEIQSNGQSMKAPFTIDGSNLIIEVKRSSKEKRPEIVMRIHGNGAELLTCSACAMFNLSNTWLKVGAEPIQNSE